MKEAQKTLGKVRKILIDNSTDTSLDDLLANAGVEFGDYMATVQTSTRGNTIVLKCDPSECKINNYNRAMMLAWQANMDIQYVVNAYSCVMYVVSYIMKTERSMGELGGVHKHILVTPNVTMSLRGEGGVCHVMLR